MVFLDTHWLEQTTFPEVQHNEIVWLYWIPVSVLVQPNNPPDSVPQIHSERSQKTISNWRDSDGMSPRLRRWLNNICFVNVVGARVTAPRRADKVRWEHVGLIEPLPGTCSNFPDCNCFVAETWSGNRFCSCKDLQGQSHHLLLWLDGGLSGFVQMYVSFQQQKAAKAKMDQIPSF